ncbi:YicC family protein [candidate division KSB1 bacterium]|nr:YicC family protein [candidate division KSB1 bacterium]MBL7094482.1 YicC family protein [candidate division KSB1 bacterium]
MVKSMTGFGRAELREKEIEISVEVRSVNNRFLDIQVRLPKSYFHLEHEVKSLVRQYASRGRLSVFVNLKSYGEDTYDGIKINQEFVEKYWSLLTGLKKKYKIPGKLKLDHLLTFQDVFIYEENGQFAEHIWEKTKNVLKESLKNFTEMRQREGIELAEDLKNRIDLMEEKVDQIEAICDQRHEDELSKIRERVKEIVNSDEVDDTRLETEIALMINRIDVTEECVRFRSHNKLFLETLENEDSVGRKLNFLLQEMTREANTIGSKANNADISHLVVEVKEEVERIREQVQNIE